MTKKKRKRMTNKNRKINLWDRKLIYPTDLLFNSNSKKLNPAYTSKHFHIMRSLLFYIQLPYIQKKLSALWMHSP